MCSLYPKGLRGCPRFTFSIRFRVVQTTDETGVSDVRSSTFLTRRYFKILNTDTRTNGSSCAREALAEGLPMTEFLRARRDLTLIGVSMDRDIGGGRWLGSPRSPNQRLDSPHLCSKPATKMLQKFTGRNRRLGASAKPQAKIFTQPAGNSVSLHLYLSDRNCTSINTCLVAAHHLSPKRAIPRSVEEDE